MRSEVLGGPETGRREFLFFAGATLASLALPLRLVRASGHALPQATKSALESSPLVYISPLLADGRESRCHGEVWFFFDGGDVVIATSADSWKARALGKGRDGARIWVGDFGVAKSGAFAKGPSFRATARLEPDRATFDRLLVSFASKYPDFSGKWEPRFQSQYADGSRVVIRYSPAGKPSRAGGG